MPHILLRFMAIKDAGKLKISRRVGTIWVVISMAVAIVIGIVGYSVVKAGAITGLEDSERIIVEIAKLISRHNALLAVVAGVILAGILAATMSTADSQLLAAASSISENLVRDAFKVELTEKKKLIVARIAVIAISIVAMFIASDANS